MTTPPVSDPPASDGPSDSNNPPAEEELSTKELLSTLLAAFNNQTRTINELSAFARTTSTVNSTPPPAPAPTVPAFIAAPVSTGKSLFDTFPFTEASTLLEVTRHELRPMDLWKLDSKLRDKADDEGNLTSFNSRASTTKDYPSLTSIIHPLNLYFRILLYFASSGGQVDIVTVLSMGMMEYIGHLHTLNQRYEWSAVLRYHMDYHVLRRHEMMNGIYSGWGRPNPDLMVEHLQGHEVRTAVKRPDSSSSDSKTKTKRVPIEQQYCFAWNEGNCTNSSCKRIHQCSVANCHSKEHMEKNCPKKKKD
ncbi:hypothetical protein L218DRAFT_954128 [Marasmius fiardii PR-910]|nr:hypothetical protein L218DRAFT_954128 [Marasmius fiardii PR-910]